MTGHDSRGTHRQGPRVVTAGEGAAGQRIDNFLVRNLKDVPRSRIYRMIRKGEVRVNGSRVKPTLKLKPSDQVRIPPVHVATAGRPAFIGDRQLERLASAIIHEDERLLVLDKPAGMAVHGGSGVSFGVIEGMRRLRPGAELELVHRLDRETSGCLLIAKRRSALRSLHAAIRAGALGKHYQLIVRGRWPAALDRIDAPLMKYVAAGGERRVLVSEEGKPSRTDFEVVARGPQATLLVATLHTGRTHQIRVHCKHAGHTILGDEKYATDVERSWDAAAGVRRLCLHASRLVLPDGEGEFEAPMPADILSLWQKLERNPA